MSTGDRDLRVGSLQFSVHAMANSPLGARFPWLAGFCDMGAPVRTHTGAAMPAASAHHALTQWPDGGVSVEALTAHFDVMAAINRATGDEQIPAAVAADVTHGNGRECLTGWHWHQHSKTTPL